MLCSSIFLVFMSCLSSVSYSSISFENLFFVIFVSTFLNFVSISSFAFVSSSISYSIYFMLIPPIVSCFSIFWFASSFSVLLIIYLTILHILFLFLLGLTFFYMCCTKKCKNIFYNNLDVLWISYILRQIYISDISA